MIKIFMIAKNFIIGKISLENLLKAIAILVLALLIMTPLILTGIKYTSTLFGDITGTNSRVDHAIAKNNNVVLHKVIEEQETVLDRVIKNQKIKDKVVDDYHKADKKLIKFTNKLQHTIVCKDDKKVIKKDKEEIRINTKEYLEESNKNYDAIFAMYMRIKDL